MSRPVIPVLIGVALVLGVIGLAPTGSRAQSESATPPAFAVPECVNDDWKSVDVRPPGSEESQIVPAVAATPGSDERELYLVAITLQPGECMPYEAKGNQKDGAVIWIVEQGIVAYTWRMASDSPPDAMPIVEVGDNRTTRGRLAENSPRRLYPGEWVAQDQRIEVSYTNMGGDTAIIWKAVWAVPDSGGCNGGCR
jgi:hypothetical protein